MKISRDYSRDVTAVTSLAGNSGHNLGNSAECAKGFTGLQDVRDLPFYSGRRAFAGFFSQAPANGCFPGAPLGTLNQNADTATNKAVNTTFPPPVT